MTILGFQNLILSWHRTNKRSMPWRKTNDPYKILVSEVMLQQTQAARVIPKYKEFLKQFPALSSLAKTSNKKLLRAWRGLGYWRRAKYLKQTAQILVRAKAMNLQTPSDLETLPGIGPYTARALACFAFGNTEAFLDTNIRRTYLHFFFKNKKNVPDKEILKIAQRAIDSLPKKITPREWHYALFDYGALVLKDKEINKQSKHYAKQSKFKGSFRSFRARIMHMILTQNQNKISQAMLQRFLRHELKKEKSSWSANDIISSLLKDGLLKKSRGAYSL
ncbi:MAG: A/G-specific adenine glycosylase [Candidatus Wildermuthbacteria bacterium]|nr:A/G-specific adenine glycosylase [Candidatus Wildermuthbacteria bacterium]